MSSVANSLMQMTMQGSVADRRGTGDKRTSNMTVGTALSYSMFKQRCESILKQTDKSVSKAPSISRSSGSDSNSSVDVGTKSIES